MDKIVKYVILLEAMITEHYEWLSEYSRLSFRMDLIRRFGASSDVREQVEAISQSSLEAKAYSTASEERILAVSGEETVEEARVLLTKLKTLLNAAADFVSARFADSLPLDGNSTESDFEAIAKGLVPDGILPDGFPLDIKDIW